MPWALVNDGRVIVIGNEAILQADSTNEQRVMQLYGKAGTSYQVEYTSDLNSWTPGSTVALTNLSTSVILASVTNEVIFYRARQGSP